MWRLTAFSHSVRPAVVRQGWFLQRFWLGVMGSPSLASVAKHVWHCWHVALQLQSLPFASYVLPTGVLSNLYSIFLTLTAAITLRSHAESSVASQALPLPMQRPCFPTGPHPQALEVIAWTHHSGSFFNPLPENLPPTPNSFHPLKRQCPITVFLLVSFLLQIWAPEACRLYLSALHHWH